MSRFPHRSGQCLCRVRKTMINVVNVVLTSVFRKQGCEQILVNRYGWHFFTSSCKPMWKWSFIADHAQTTDCSGVVIEGTKVRSLNLIDGLKSESTEDTHHINGKALKPEFHILSLKDGWLCDHKLCTCASCDDDVMRIARESNSRAAVVSVASRLVLTERPMIGSVAASGTPVPPQFVRQQPECCGKQHACDGLDSEIP